MCSRYCRRKIAGVPILKLAYELLRPGGISIIHIQYQDGTRKTTPKHWSYKLNPLSMKSYGIEEFWEISKTIGFQTLAMKLVPVQPLVNDRSYAYYYLQKK